MNPNNNLKQSKQKAHKALKTQRTNRLKLEPKYDKPRANASRLTKNFVDANPKYDHKEVKKYLKNTLVNSRPIRGATYGAQSSSVCHLQSAGTIPPNASGDGAILFTNNPYYPVTFLKQTDAGHELGAYFLSQSGQPITPNDTSYYSFQANYGVEDTIQVPIQMYEFPHSGSLWVDTNYTVHGGCIAFAGRFSQISGTLLSTETTPVAASVRILYWAALDSPVTVLANIGMNVSSTVGTGNWTYTAAVPQYGYYSVQYRRSTATSTNLTIPQNYVKLIYAAGYKWTELPVINNPENTLLKEWIDSCKQIRVPAADLLVSNFNAEIFKNGKIGAVYVPPDELLGVPKSPEECYNYITVNPQKIQKAVNMPLSTGMHVPWIGFDMSAFEFRRNMAGVVSESSVSKLSGWLISWRANTTEEMTQPMDIFLNMSLEGITKQTILPALPCPHVLALWNEWNNFRAHHTLISENPKHIKKAARMVGNFLKDKNNQEMLLKAGLALASSLVTLL